MAAESFPMNGGDGVYSYARNSKFQRAASDAMTGMIKAAILEKLDTKFLTSKSNTFCIVDFGCSVGPNTFFTVENVVETIKDKCSSQGHHNLKNLEFQVLLNDHVGNDFNTLFSAIPSKKQYYVTAAPGSFYNRLFPRSSIHFAHSSHALQWLSRVPEVLLDRNSKAWNQGRIHYTGACREVVDAYAAQFEKDFGDFLSARADEIVTEGMMALIMPGIPDGICHSDHPMGVSFSFLGSRLMDMANEGKIDKAEIDSFNLPFYAPNITEVKTATEKNGCFSTEVIEVTDPKTTIHAHGVTLHLRAAFEGIFTRHFGKKIADEMFDRTFKTEEEISKFLDPRYLNKTQLFVVLKRK